ncbi:hypothetical protein KCU95_g17187, partial [Aureobasidium melanogenum]
MMLTSKATLHVPPLSSADPAPIDIHLDDDMNTNTTSDTTLDTSKKTTSSGPTSAEPTYVKMQTNAQTAESVTEITQPPVSTPAETQSASEEVKMDIDRDKSATEESTKPESVEETTSASPLPPEGPECSHTTPIPAQDATSEATSKEDADRDTVEGATITPPSTGMSKETELEGPKPVVAEVEDPEATMIESSIESPADQESGLSTTEATDATDLDAVENSGNSGGEVKDASSKEQDPNTPAEEVIHAQGGSDHEEVASKNISPAEVFIPNPDSTPGASQSDDTTTQVLNLHATYDSSGESRASKREEEKMEDDSVPGAQGEHASSDYDKVMTAKPVVDSNSIAMTSESTAEQKEEATISPVKTQGSLFGGPAGKQISPIAEAPQTLGVDSVAQPDTPGGLENLIEDMTGISTESNSLLEQSDSFDTGNFALGANSTEEDAGPDAQKDIESEAVLGAQREVASPPPGSDHDAKPDISAYPSNASPAPSHTTSSTNSQLSHKTSATQAEELNELINSGDLYPPETDAKDFPAEYLDLEETSNGTDQAVLESAENVQLCNCEFEYPCSHCKVRWHNLRPRKDDYVYFGNQIPDTDTSGTYTDDPKYYPSSREVAREDRDVDEETNEDGERDYLMSGGLVSENTDLMGRFTRTIPFNETDPLIRDKNPFEEESSSEDEAESKKSKKRKKKNRSTRQAKRPRITDMTDEPDIQPPHPLSKASRSVRKTATRITEITEEFDTQPTHCRRERSHVLPHLSTTLGTLSESLQRRQSGSGASKPTKKTTSKKKTSNNTSSTQPTQTIIQMVQRVAKPLTTKLSYPIHFNARSLCSICSCPSYAIIGTGSSRTIKIYDFGHGNREISNANEAGNPQPMQPKPQETSLCLACTTSYMKVLMCKTHDVVPLEVKSVFDISAAFAKATNKQCTSDEVKGWCSLCPAPASYCCDKNCGAKFCDTCASKVYAEDGDLNAMLDQTKDEITHEYKHGLRADVELLRKGGELEKFLARMAGAGRGRTG